MDNDIEISEEVQKEIIKIGKEVQDVIKKAKVPINIPMVLAVNAKLDALIKTLIESDVIKAEKFALYRSREERDQIKQVVEAANEQFTKKKIIIPKGNIRNPGK